MNLKRCEWCDNLDDFHPLCNTHYGKMHFQSTYTEQKCTNFRTGCVISSGNFDRKGAKNFSISWNAKKRRKISDFKIKVEKFSFFSASLRKSLFCQGRRMNTQWWQMSMTRARWWWWISQIWKKGGWAKKPSLYFSTMVTTENLVHFLMWDWPKAIYEWKKIPS